MIANILTVGHLLYKMITGEEYSFLVYLIFIVIVLILQGIFAFLLEVKNADGLGYVAVTYGVLQPIVLCLAFWVFYQISEKGALTFWLVVWEIVKILIILAVFEGIFAFWILMAKTQFHRLSRFLAFSYGFPSVGITGLGVYRYIMRGVELDRFFIGFLLLIAATPILAAITKSIEPEDGSRRSYG